jgi:BirA family transcriptional regulator, biotin operon repressor / biotin---[acetyl-CoA-carboxylase] ligase
MIHAPDWQAAVDPERRVGHAVEHHATIGSTNDRAWSALAEAGGEGLAVVADQQEAGRGRRGRTWLSPPGRNLMVSVGIRPRLEPARAGLLGIGAALAVRDACRSLVPAAALSIRWPNDVVTADGLKVAGLLLETTLAGERVADAVIGMGINVNWRRREMPGEIGVRATSLADLAGTDLDRVTLLRLLLQRLDDEISALEAGRSPVDRFRETSALDGRHVEVEVGEDRLEGTVAGIADDGSLLLDTPAGRVALSMGEVVAVRDAAVEATA